MATWIKRLWSRICFGFCCGILVLPVPSSAQASQFSDRDLTALLARMHANLTGNAKLAQQYTSVMERRNVDSFAKDGAPGKMVTAKFENMFVEGIPYQRMFESNGMPLNAAAAAAEQKKLDQAARERRAMTLDQKRRFFHIEYHSALPVCCLATLFKNRIVGRETIDGRDTVVVESRARYSAVASTKEEKSSLDWKETTWIDLQDSMPVRIKAESLSDHEQFEKGMTAEIDYIRVLEPPSSSGKAEKAVWLQSRSISHFRFRTVTRDGAGTTEQIWSNYKRFQADVRLLDESIQEVR